MLISKSGCLQSCGVTITTFGGQFDFLSLGKLGEKNQTGFPRMGVMVNLVRGQQAVKKNHTLPAEAAGRSTILLMSTYG